MSLTNLIETHSRRAASVCVVPCSTSRTARSRNSIGCGLPITDPHICLNSMESQGKHHGNPESDQGRHALARDAVPIIPIRKNGRLWKEDCPAAIARNETLRATRYYGRAFWKRWTGYHARSRIEAKMRCLMSFGERIAARDPDRQTAEIHIRITLMNRFNALGTAEIVRVA